MDKNKSDLTELRCKYKLVYFINQIKLQLFLKKVKMWCIICLCNDSTIGVEIKLDLQKREYRCNFASQSDKIRLFKIKENIKT